jgi:hypothetical protein
MAVLTPTAAKGRTLFEAGGIVRTHDDRADAMASGVYSHNPLEWSATEADEWCSWLLWAQGFLSAGLGALAAKNNTGGDWTAGTLLCLQSYDSVSACWTFAKADGASPTLPAQYVVLATIANGATGSVYAYGAVTGLNTSGASAVGAPAYLSATTPGACTFTAPADPQVVGRVTVKDATVGAILFWPGGVNCRTLPRTHASTHQDGGADEVGTATPAANVIPKADAAGHLDSWITLAGIGAQASNAWLTALANAAANPVITLTDAATIAIDATLRGPYQVTLGGNRVLGLPTGGVADQIAVVDVIQDGSGNRTLDVSAYALPVDGSGTSYDTPVQPTAAGARGRLTLLYSGGVWRIANYVMYAS